jgi:hypothetical protein
MRLTSRHHHHHHHHHQSRAFLSSYTLHDVIFTGLPTSALFVRLLLNDQKTVF